MYYYRYQEELFASLTPDLPLEQVTHPGETPDIFLLDRSAESGRTAFCVSDARQLTGAAEDVSWLDPSRMDAPPPLLPRRMQRKIDARALRAVNFRHPLWNTPEVLHPAPNIQCRVHLLAVGDVGSTLLMGLKLLGADCIGSIGIHDLNDAVTQRWVAEMGQVSWPWDYDALPPVEAVSSRELFDCEVFLFAASKGVPPVTSGISDVRMAQLSANRAIIEAYAKKARAAGFRGLFAVLSDPVEPLCKAAYLASNLDETGHWDGQGLRGEQIQGFGLGVMNARAANLAQREPRYRSFLEDGRTFGPHGEGLVVANSLEHYDHALSLELTNQVLAANRRIRELGFKPYAAPALSSGALQLLLTLRGQWHCASVCLGNIWFGARTRFTPAGTEVETHALPEALFARIRESAAQVEAIK